MNILWVDTLKWPHLHNNWTDKQFVKVFSTKSFGPILLCKSFFPLKVSCYAIYIIELHIYTCTVYICIFRCFICVL